MKVVGISGVFLRSKNPVRLAAWYKEVLNLELDEWRGKAFNTKDDQIVFSLFPEDSSYIPYNQRVMINFHVDNIDEYIKKFEELDVQLQRVPEVSEYGKFIWINDIEGNLIELWERPQQ